MARNRALEGRMARIFGLADHTAIKGQPRKLAIEESVRRGG